MFSHKMREAVEGVVRIDDMHPAVFKELLRFVPFVACSCSHRCPLLGLCSCVQVHLHQRLQLWQRAREERQSRQERR